MNFTRFLFLPVLSIATTVVTSCVIVAPTQAVEIIFSSPRVLSGINGVSFTLPSTGTTRIYNITLKRGTLTEVFGTPPMFDVTNQIDAVAAMEESAQGINSFLSGSPGDIWFESFGTDVFYLPYGINLVNGFVPVSRSRYVFPNGIIPDLTEIPPDTPVVYADLVAVPEPVSTISFLALGTLGAASTLKRKLKPSKSTGKETIKVG